MFPLKNNNKMSQPRNKVLTLKMLYLKISNKIE